MLIVHNCWMLESVTFYTEANFGAVSAIRELYARLVPVICPYASVIIPLRVVFVLGAGDSDMSAYMIIICFFVIVLFSVLVLISYIMLKVWYRILPLQNLIFTRMFKDNIYLLFVSICMSVLLMIVNYTFLS